jgi:hypothetical protein
LPGHHPFLPRIPEYPRAGFELFAAFVANQFGREGARLMDDSFATRSGINLNGQEQGPAADATPGGEARSTPVCQDIPVDLAFPLPGYAVGVCRKEHPGRRPGLLRLWQPAFLNSQQP